MGDFPVPYVMFFETFTRGFVGKMMNHGTLGVTGVSYETDPIVSKQMVSVKMKRLWRDDLMIFYGW